MVGSPCQHFYSSYSFLKPGDFGFFPVLGLELWSRSWGPFAVPPLPAPTVQNWMSCDQPLPHPDLGWVTWLACLGNTCVYLLGLGFPDSQQVLKVWMFCINCEPVWTNCWASDKTLAGWSTEYHHGGRICPVLESKGYIVLCYCETLFPKATVWVSPQCRGFCR